MKINIIWAILAVITIGIEALSVLHIIQVTTLLVILLFILLTAVSLGLFIAGLEDKKWAAGILAVVLIGFVAFYLSFLPWPLFDASS